MGSTGLGQTDVRDTVALGDDLDRLGPNLFVELLAFVDFRALLVVFHLCFRFSWLCQIA